MQVAIGLYPDFTALDVVGPYELLSRLPDVDLVWVAARRGEVVADTGMFRIGVDRTFDEVPSPDVLLVGGGAGCADERTAAVVDWVRAAHPSTTWTTSVCTGSLILARAGLLDGVPATTHWAYREVLAGLGAVVSEERVVREGKVWTAAGVSAGIDMALALVGEIVGEDVARALQLGIEYDPAPPYAIGDVAPEMTSAIGAALLAGDGL